MYKIDKKIKITVVAIIVILFSVVGYYIYANSEESEVLSYNEALSTNIVEDDTEKSDKNIKNEQNTKNTEITENTQSNIIVHVAGCVANPGIVHMKENDRIADAIEKAGGLTQEGDISTLNLAYFLEDGMKIYVPSHNEIEEEKAMEKDNNSSTEYVTVDSGTSGSKSNNSAEPAKKNNTKVNINTASQSELETLPGIGSATALKIISYREENGKFEVIEDIKNVKGIGDSKYEKIKDLICVK